MAYNYTMEINCNADNSLLKDLIKDNLIETICDLRVGQVVFKKLYFKGSYNRDDIKTIDLDKSSPFYRTMPFLGQKINLLDPQYEKLKNYIHSLKEVNKEITEITLPDFWNMGFYELKYRRIKYYYGSAVNQIFMGTGDRMNPNFIDKTLEIPSQKFLHSNTDYDGKDLFNYVNSIGRYPDCKNKCHDLQDILELEPLEPFKDGAYCQLFNKVTNVNGIYCLCF